MKYREPTNKPCSDCPFRRKSMPGWLGASAPERFIGSIMTELPLPCHQTIDYDGDPSWKEKWEAQEIGSICAGALILSANLCKMPRDREFPRMKSDREQVFATPNEFIDHHRKLGVGSWHGLDDEFEDEP